MAETGLDPPESGTPACGIPPCPLQTGSREPRLHRGRGSESQKHAEEPPSCKSDRGRILAEVSNDAAV